MTEEQTCFVESEDVMLLRVEATLLPYKMNSLRQGSCSSSPPCYLMTERFWSL